MTTIYQMDECPPTLRFLFHSMDGYEAGRNLASAGKGDHMKTYRTVGKNQLLFTYIENPSLKEKKEKLEGDLRFIGAPTSWRICKTN